MKLQLLTIWPFTGSLPISAINALDYYQLPEHGIHLHTKVSFVQTVPLTWNVIPSLMILILQSPAQAPTIVLIRINGLFLCMQFIYGM